MCLAHESQIKQKLGISGVSAITAAWRSTTSDPGAQIDLVIDRRDQVINLCEMKFSIQEYEIDKAYNKKLETKIRAFAAETKTKKALHTTLISTYGLKRNKYAGAIQSEVTMEDLFH